MQLSKTDARKHRKIRIRKKISGTGERPRLVVYRSNMHIYAQIVDDTTGKTLASASTLKNEGRDKSASKNYCNKAAAAGVGKEIARLAGEKNIKQVVFDRNGYLYHGRIQSLADSARENGLEF